MRISRIFSLPWNFILEIFSEKHAAGHAAMRKIPKLPCGRSAEYHQALVISHWPLVIKTNNILLILKVSQWDIANYNVTFDNCHNITLWWSLGDNLIAFLLQYSLYLYIHKYMISQNWMCRWWHSFQLIHAAKCQD